MQVYAPRSPLTEALGEKVNEALALWEMGEERKAALALRGALDMAEKDADCQATYEALRKRIPQKLEEQGKRATTLRRWIKKNPVLVVLLLYFLLPLALLFCLGGISLLTGLLSSRTSRTRHAGGPGVPGVPVDVRPTEAGEELDVSFTDYRLSLEAGKSGKLTVAIDRWKSDKHQGDITLKFEAPSNLTVLSQVKLEKGQVEVEVPVTAGAQTGKFEVRVVPEA